MQTTLESQHNIDNFVIFVVIQGGISFKRAYRYRKFS